MKPPPIDLVTAEASLQQNLHHPHLLFFYHHISLLHGLYNIVDLEKKRQLNVHIRHIYCARWLAQLSATCRLEWNNEKKFRINFSARACARNTTVACQNLLPAGARRARSEVCIVLQYYLFSFHRISINTTEKVVLCQKTMYPLWNSAHSYHGQFGFLAKLTELQQVSGSIDLMPAQIMAFL